MTQPTLAELYEVVKAAKRQIEPDFLAYAEDDVPGILLTIGIADDGSWDYQLGCNEYHGSAYFFPHWVVVSVHRNSNCLELARAIKLEWGQTLSPLGEAALAA